MEDFEYIYFSKRRTGRRMIISDGYAKLHYHKKGGKVDNPYSCITFNSAISEKIRNKQYNWLRLRQNNLTGQLYFVFQSDETDDGTKVSLSTKNDRSKTISVYNKGLVEYIINSLEITGDKDIDVLLNIGNDLSRIDGAIVLLIDIEL